MVKTAFLDGDLREDALSPSAFRILRHLEDTTELSIVYSGEGYSKLQESFENTDADCAADKGTCRSVSSSITKLNGGPMLWFSRQQKPPSSRTTEAESISVADETQFGSQQSSMSFVFASNRSF